MSVTRMEKGTGGWKSRWTKERNNKMKGASDDGEGGRVGERRRKKIQSTLDATVDKSNLLSLYDDPDILIQ